MCLKRPSNLVLSLPENKKNMEFSPNNPIVKLCLQGMTAEEKGNALEANAIFLQAWNEATNDHERFLAAYFVARQQKDVSNTLKWLQTALQLALNVNDHSTASALPGLYLKIGKAYDDMGDYVNSAKNYELANSLKDHPVDKGPFYHGTKADLNVGDLLTAGVESNYKSKLLMNHIYFTALPNGAGLAAALAKGEGRERVYMVEPTGNFENDPNVTDKKFPGNPTRSYRSTAPLKIIGEVTEWQRMPEAELQKFKEKLENNKGDIIN
jgi:tetratricopeptide (TPR) repeat protein